MAATKQRRWRINSIKQHRAASRSTWQPARGAVAATRRGISDGAAKSTASAARENGHINETKTS
jgi:hypothetical protein